MATTSSRPPRPAPRGADTRSTGKPTRPKLLWLWVALGAVVVLIAGIAIVTAGGDDEELTVGSTVPADGGSATTAGGDAGSGGGAGQIAESWPVEVSGAPLVELPRGGGDPSVGVTAPGLSGFGFDGTPVAVDPAQGPVMLVFLAHWCPHCNREIPKLNEWRDSGAMPDGLQVVGVTTATDPAGENYPPSEWIPRMDWTWPVIADSPDLAAARAFGVSGFPFTVLLDADGEVLTRWSGELGLAELQARVDAALA